MDFQAPRVMPVHYKIILTFILTQLSYAKVETAISMVPRGKFVEQIGRDFIIKTVAGTKIGIEFTRRGFFEEAKGINLNKGDELEPGEGLISLSSAAQKLVIVGKDPEGYWNLEHDKELGWIYEFKDSAVNAKTGEIIPNYH